jgi:hypothetical protein
MPVKLRVVGPAWTEKDWENATSFVHVAGKVTIAPIRHPANDNTWTVGIYVPFVSDLVGYGHRLQSYATKCETYEEALRAASFMSYDLKRQYLGIRIPEDGHDFWERVRATYP